jgi:hypothetical protein
MMRAALLASLVLTTAAFGQDAAKRDYSPDALRHVLTATDDRPPSPQTVHWGFGSVEFRAFNMNWRIMYLPFNMPFSGSVRGSDPSSMWPDPFALNHAQFAETPRTWQDNREISSERKRIEKSMRDRASIVAKP